MRDHSGERFGMLTVLDFSHTRKKPSGGNVYYWNVVCDCGTKKSVDHRALGNPTISCGCYRKNNNRLIRRILPGMNGFNTKYSDYKSRANKHNRVFEFTKEQFREIIEKPCHYCGTDRSTCRLPNEENGKYWSNGIDRINSDEGYTLSNCVPCCYICNTMKSTLSEREFKDHVEKIYLFYVFSIKKAHL